ncbi:MAG: serpin family protein [Eubacteriales bacterium]
MKCKILLKSALSLTLASAVLFCTVACGQKIHADELSDGYYRRAGDTGEVTDEFKTAVADFSFDLFRTQLSEKGENSLISPLSAILCLGMIAGGADGETLAQMEELFGMSADDLNRCLYAYTASLYSAKDCKVTLANSAWIREGFAVNSDFLQTNADWYDAQIYRAPFDETTRKDINNWVKEQTDGMIDKILDAPIDPATVLYLINTLCFDAEWAEKYESGDRKNHSFTSYDGSESTVKMLFSEESYYIDDENGAKGFIKPYAGNRYGFLALLPDEGVDLYDYLDTLNGEKWTELWENKGGAVKAGIPEFTFETAMNLNDTLKSMGVTDLFDPALCNLSGISSDELYVSEFAQKTYIQVDQNGTKAAAATWGAMSGASAEPMSPFEVILDRPFVFAIVDLHTGTPLFLGTVTDL